MGKKRGQQESVQLSFFDAYEPEVPEINSEPQEELTPEVVVDKEEEAEDILLIEEVQEEPAIVEPEETLLEEEAQEESVTMESEEVEEIIPIAEEPEVPEEPILIEEEPEEPETPEVTYSYEGRKPSLTERIFDPMVIYFNANDCPQETAEEEIPIPPVLSNKPIEQEAVEEEPVAEEIPNEDPAMDAPEETETVVEEITSEPEEAESLEALPLIPLVPEETGRGKKVLITGASGFIGGYLVAAALERGYEVWAGVRMNSNRSRLTDERIHFIDLAYENEDILTAQLENFREEQGAWEYIIHNAGVTKTNNKMDFFRVNAENTHRLIEALNVANCRPNKFLLMSSLSSYGMGDEKDFTPIGLDDAQRPNTAYGLSKLEAENYVRRQTYFPYIILRPTGVYGPGELDYFMEIRAIHSGFDFAVGMTPQRITFIYVKDLARVAFLALEKEEICNKHYFVADGDVYTDQSFAHLIQELLGRKRVFRARIPTGLVYVACLFSEFLGKISGKGMTLNTDKYKILKQRNWICDVRPLQDDLGFVPAYNLRKGLTESIAWYKEQRWF